MLMNAAVNAATTVALSGGSLPDWFFDLILCAFVFSLPFWVPNVIKVLLYCFVDKE